MKLVWMSDIHLNFLDEKARFDFYNKIKGDIVVISGDIAESNTVSSFIKEMETVTKLPVYFVLGNHDFYRSSITSVKRSVKPLRYLPKFDFVRLNASIALLGVDGWGDCRNGDYDYSRIIMNDWLHIQELRREYFKGKDALKIVLQKLADKDARALKRKVNKAIKNGFTKIILVSHVPAFEEACLYAGRKSTPDGLPFFSSRILGETILPVAKKHPKVDFLWLSGHTHSRVIYKPCANMVVKVAKSEYFLPQIEETFNV